MRFGILPGNLATDNQVTILQMREAFVSVPLAETLLQYRAMQFCFGCSGSFFKNVPYYPDGEAPIASFGASPSAVTAA